MNAQDIKKSALIQEYEEVVQKLLSLEEVRANEIDEKIINSQSKKLKASGNQSFIKGNESDSLALVTLYNSTNGENWTNNDNWLSGPLQSWYGVLLDSVGRVDTLALSNNNLSGSLSAELGGLNSLKYLTFNRNNLVGTIPIELGSLLNLNYLRLSQNQFAGEIPSSFGGLDSLRFLSITNAGIWGAIPKELGNLVNLTSLALYGNWLSEEIPAELGNLINLEYLGLQQNKLSGTIPPELGNLSKAQNFYLNDNELEGEIPAELGNLSSLISLWLDDNNLSGSIPPELGNLKTVYNFLIQGNQLSGEIPSELGKLKTLGNLWLALNQLSGEIPEELSTLGSININFSGNKLSGEISSVFLSADSIKSLDLSYNLLSGELPEVADTISRLHTIDLSHNNLSGEILPSIGNLKKLQTLNLGNNNFTGEVPLEIIGLIGLDRMVLENNSFTSLPGLKGLSSLRYLGVSNLELTFKDIIPNLGVASISFTYSPQLPFGDTTFVNVAIDSSIVISVAGIDYEGNEYQWEKNGFELPGEDSLNLSINEVQLEDFGEYTVRVTNEALPDLEVISEPFFVVEDSTRVFNEDGIETGIPLGFSLNQNYPNPFNPSTRINYSIPEATEINIKVFDITGRLVSTLVNERKSVGSYTVEFDAFGLSSGVYLYRIQTPAFTQIKRMLLIK